MIKAIFLDIDGTLLSFKTHKISKKTLKSLYLVKEKGIKIFTATGRHKSETNCLENFPFDGYITLNGQYCYDSEENIIHKKSIDNSEIAKVISILKDDHFACFFLEGENIFSNMINNDVKKALSLLKLKPYPILPIEQALNREILQIIAFISPEKETEIMPLLSNCDSTRWHNDFIDIIPKGGSKKVGIEKIIDLHGISKSETLAIGDGENDIAMLDFVNTSIAMGNASDVVKQHADYITSDVDHEGITQALKHFKII